MTVVRLQQSEVSEELAKALADNVAHPLRPICDLPTGCLQYLNAREEIRLVVVDANGQEVRYYLFFCSDAHKQATAKAWGLKI